MRVWILMLVVGIVGALEEVGGWGDAKGLGEGLAFVMGYRQGCQNCEAEEKELDNAEKLFEGIVKFRKIDVDNIPSILLQGKKLNRNPSYFFVKGSIQDIKQYKQKVSRIAIAKFILSEIQSLIKSRNALLFPPSSSSSKPKPKPSSSSSSSSPPPPKQKGVTILTDNNFQQQISNGAWFVQFYSPTCGHCQALQPQFDQLPTIMGKRVNVGKINSPENRAMSQKYQIKGYPTLLFFPKGSKDKSKPIPYQGERTAQAMSSWLATQDIQPQKVQFTKLSKQKYIQECNKNIVCLIFILDTKKQLKQLDFMEEILQENKGKPLRFFYSARLPHFQQTLMIEDRSAPKLVSIWDSLNSYKVFNSEIQEDSLREFIKKIMERKSWVKFGDKAQKVLFGEVGGNQL